MHGANTTPLPSTTTTTFQDSSRSITLEASKETSGSFATAHRAADSAEFVDVIHARVHASVDVATGGPVAIAAASDLEAAMRLTSTTAPLVKQSLCSTSGHSSATVMPVDTAQALSPTDKSSSEQMGSISQGVSSETAVRSTGNQDGMAQEQGHQQSMADSMEDVLAAQDRVPARDSDSQVCAVWVLLY